MKLKMTQLAKDIQAVYKLKQINEEDVLELYRENYLNTQEALHIIKSKGGK